MPIFHETSRSSLNLRVRTGGFGKHSKTLIEIYFKYIALSNQMIYLSASRLKPSYYAAKVNEPCETHLLLSPERECS